MNGCPNHATVGARYIVPLHHRLLGVSRDMAAIALNHKFLSFEKRTRRRKTWRGASNVPAASTVLASRTIARFGDGTGSRGLAENSRSTIPQRGRCSAKSLNYGRNQSIQRSIVGTSSGGSRRKRTARRARGMHRPSNAKMASAFRRSDRIRRAESTNIALRSREPRGEFLQLTPTAAEHIARAIEFSRHLPRSRKRNSVDERERREDRAYDAWAYDQLDNAVPAFHKQPFVAVA